MISSATNTKQFNGEYGCLYWGEIAHNKRARIDPPTAEHLLRTPEQMKQWASMATDGKAVYGVKGKCVLAEHIELT